MEERFSLTPWDLCHEDQFLGAAQTRRCRQPPVNGEQQPDVGKAAYGSTPYPPSAPCPRPLPLSRPLNRKKSLIKTWCFNPTVYLDFLKTRVSKAKSCLIFISTQNNLSLRNSPRFSLERCLDTLERGGGVPLGWRSAPSSFPSSPRCRFLWASDQPSCGVWARACLGSDPTGMSLGLSASFPHFNLGVWLCKEKLFSIFPVLILRTMASKLSVGDLNSLQPLLLQGKPLSRLRVRERFS